MPATATPKIIYIDDTPEARSLVVRLLTASDYTVLTANEPLSGIDLAAKEHPDLVLLDVNMPHMSGREVAMRLKKILPGVPLVAFSADVSPGARERALAAGCVGYLTKPLDVDLFPDQIAAFLNGKRETAPNLAEIERNFQAELVERLEEQVREVSKIAEHNSQLNLQNQKLVIDLQRRQRLLEAGARVGQSITSILDLDQLLSSTVDIICEEFGFYYAAIFLIDPTGESAVLHAGRGEAGAAMLAQGHKLAVGGHSMIGAAINSRQARIALDVGEERQHFKNPLLPHTRSEMALPLLTKDAVLGAMTVQSDQVNAFGNDDVTALQSLANQVAIALNNARLLRDLETANSELLRNKTFEAIATATGEAIHWVGNKATPIRESGERISADLRQMLTVFKTVLDLPAAEQRQHPYWPLVASTWALAEAQGVDFQTMAQELTGFDVEQLEMRGWIESILEDLAIIHQAATTILSIKEDLIGPVRRRTVTAVNVTEMLKQAIFEMGLPEGVVETTFAPDLPPAKGDARQISQVYNNLIKNAWEALYRTPNPKIYVSAQLAEDPNYVLTQIRDNGPGIPPEALEKIWVPFYTTKSNRGGTGLGLSACHGIITQSEGKIMVESEVGVGTVFTVQLLVLHE